MRSTYGKLVSDIEMYNTTLDLEEPLFGKVLRPILVASERRLQRRLSALGQPFGGSLSRTALEGPLSHLASQLSQMMEPALILELNVARLRGELDGKTSRDRFIDFVGRLSDSGEARRLIDAYPVLARSVLRVARSWVDATAELLCRAYSDRHLISEKFLNGAPLGPVHGLGPGMSDPHRRQRTVVLVTFESGLELTYKPRPMAVDVHFQDLLRWLNAHGVRPALRVLRTVDRGSYGWQETVKHNVCDNADGLVKFYLRAGSLLALAHLLRATDLHKDNIIADGEHPILVDVETFFHRDVSNAPSDVVGYTDEILDTSVLRTGLLPQGTWWGGMASLDNSGLTGGEGWFVGPTWTDRGLDTMRRIDAQQLVKPSANRPTLRLGGGLPLKHVDAVVDGFRATYKLLVRYRHELVAYSGPLRSFDKDSVRHLLRSTQLYGLYLDKALHPDNLRTTQDQLAFFYRLRTGEFNYPEPLIRAESEDLINGDIPIFTTAPASRDLRDSRGRMMKHYFREDGMSLVLERLRTADDEDLERQIWLTRAALEGRVRLPVGPERNKDSTLADHSYSGNSLGEENELLRAALSIGERLEALCVGHAGNVTWVGRTLLVDGRWVTGPVGVDLYSGLSGIALFLAFLASETGKSLYTDLSRKAIGQALRQWRENPPVPKHFQRQEHGEDPGGGYIGSSSMLYTLSHLAALWNDRRLVEEALRVHTSLADPQWSSNYDLLAGCAGRVLALLALKEVTDSEEVFAVAKSCGDKLAVGLNATNTVYPSWPSSFPGYPPLAGFSHGTAGISYALCKLGSCTGDATYHQVALKGLAYERDLFSAEHANWKDLRPPVGSKSGDEAADDKRVNFTTAWCHGAPGIALGRLLTLESDIPLTPQERSHFMAEISVGLRTTMREGLGGNHCLCHGELGNLETVLVASEVLDDPTLHAAALERGTQIASQILEGGWRCGTAQEVEIPGLMTGLAGIGFGLLRLNGPGRVPSILGMGAPPTRS